jgi:hypothetical protein
LEAESARDILLALLAPSQKQKDALNVGDVWVTEARQLLTATLGLKLITRGKTWESIASELWRFLLLSEFAFDLPGALPARLGDVPRAEAHARPLIEGLCEDLRDNARTRATYIERADEVERILDLADSCRDLSDLGVRDTFPFEERVVLARAVAAFEADRLDDIRAILDRHSGSVWTSGGESQEQWSLLETALRLAEACDDAQRQLPDRARSLDKLVEHYATSLSEVDRRQREFEQARADIISHDDAIRGDFARLAGPRSMAAYRRGLSYFHGGASLQEAVVPVLTVRLRQAQEPQPPKTKVALTYKDGAKRITTRLPVVTLQAEAGDMFALHSDLEILLEAHDRKGNVVGEAKPGGSVNSATGTITLKPGQPIQVPVRMHPEYQGKFTLKALNPVTLATYDSIDMETDYAV